MLEHFRERMETLYLFRPLLELQTRSQRFPEYDLASLALGVLLFILEQMLHGRRERCGPAEIREFLKTTLSDAYDESPGDEVIAQLEEYLLARLRNDGQQFRYDYHDLHAGQEKRFAFELIKMSEYDPETRRVGFELTEQGMEMLFRTREMSQELRVGFAQLYLRQQVQRGTFDRALEALNTLKLEVRAQRERLENFVQRIYYNLRQIDPGDYRREYERTQEILQSEQKEFRFLQGLLKEERETRESIVAPTEGDLEALRQLKKIELNLNWVSNEHSQLLTQRLSVDNLLLQELRAELQRGFRIRFRIEDEIVNPLVTRPDSGMDASRVGVDPVLPPWYRAHFNPLRAYERQIQRQAAEEKVEDVEEIEAEGADEEDARIRDQYVRYLRMISELAMEFDRFTLEQLVDYQPTAVQGELKSSRDFFQFLMILHQEGYLDVEGIMKQPDQWLDSGEFPLTYLVSRAFDRSGDSLPAGIRIEDSAEVLVFDSNYISNLRFHRDDGRDDG